MKFVQFLIGHPISLFERPTLPKTGDLINLGWPHRLLGGQFRLIARGEKEWGKMYPYFEIEYVGPIPRDEYREHSVVTIVVHRKDSR